MSNGEPTKAWSSSVPEFFYDLIGRIPPGMLLIFLISWEVRAFPNPDSVLCPDNWNWLLKANAGLMAALLFLLVGAGFSVGIFLHAFSVKIGRYFDYVTWRLTDDQVDLITPALERCPFSTLGIQTEPKAKIKAEIYKKRDTLYREMRLYVAQNSKMAADLLPKAAAETSLFFNTASAVLIWILIRVAKLFLICRGEHFSNPHFPFVICILVPFIFIVIFVRFRFWRSKELKKKKQDSSNGTDKSISLREWFNEVNREIAMLFLLLPLVLFVAYVSDNNPNVLILMAISGWIVLMLMGIAETRRMIEGHLLYLNLAISSKERRIIAPSK